jgi:thioredoxin-related protein
MNTKHASQTKTFVSKITICLLIIIFCFSGHVVFANKGKSTLDDLVARYEELEKSEKKYIRSKGGSISDKELQTIKEGKDKLIVMIEMENPLYQDDFPRNLFPRVIRELIAEHSMSITEAEQMINQEQPLAKEIFNRIGRVLTEEKRNLARIRVQQRQRVNNKK